MVKERNEIWNTQEEYLNILLKEESKEKALLKYLGHSVCDLALIKRKLRILQGSYNLEDIDLYIDELIVEKRSLINILKAGLKGDKSE